MSTGIKQAVILAGGLGKRLHPLTVNLPKPMVQVAGRPFLEYLVELLKDNGIEEIILLLGFLPEKITAHFGDGRNFGVRIRYSVSGVDDETGTRLKKAEKLLNQKFLLLYGDNYWPLALKSLAGFYESRRAAVLTTVYANRDGRGEYGRENNIHIDADGYATCYDCTRKTAILNGVDIGFFILDNSVVQAMPNDANFSFEKEILPKLIAERKLAGYLTDHPYYSITDTERLRTMEKFLKSKKVIFLDRDGVINKKMPPHDYVKQWREFEFLPGAIEAVRILTDAGYQIYIITNQAGVGRGLITKKDLEEIHGKMLNELESNGARVSGIYCCHHSWSDGCECRKPKPGLLLQAARDHYLDLTKAIFIGDSESDLTAGKAAGCKTILLQENESLLDVVNNLR